MTAWILTDSKGIPLSRSMYELMEGFEHIGEEIQFYTAADIFAENIPYTDDNIVVGHNDHCIRHVEKISGKKYTPIDYPSALKSYLYRDIEQYTLGWLRDRINQGFVTEDNPVFVKTIKQKYITGFVCNGMSDYVSHCSGYDDDVKIHVSEVLDIISEYRVYVHWHDVVDCRRYKGDWSVAPDKKVIDNMLDLLKNENMPCSYSIDVGITDFEDTFLVECNDGFALGNYGLCPSIYAQMHRDRWFQMVNS